MITWTDYNFKLYMRGDFGRKNKISYSEQLKDFEPFFDKTQEYVSGKVKVALCKDNIIMAGRESSFILCDQAQSSMDMLEVSILRIIGFIKINTLRLIDDALRKRKK